MRLLFVFCLLTMLVGTSVAMVKKMPSVDTTKVVVSPAHHEPVPPASDENKIVQILGWVVVGLGVLVILFVSILIGAIAILGGVVMVLLGRRKRAKQNDDTPEAMEDVVYLKNGSIIRGTIIEQVPGTSLKIQTKDGSVFFYQMTEVEKMTKEKRRSE